MTMAHKATDQVLANGINIDRYMMVGVDVVGCTVLYCMTVSLRFKGRVKVAFRKKKKLIID